MIRAIIFDLDGTLVQTEKLKALSYAKAAVELRPELSEQVVFAAFADVVDLSRHECLVIEDSPTGVKAALAAGMSCIAVGTPFTRKALHMANLIDTRWIVDDPRDLFAVVNQLLTDHAG